MNDQQQDVTWQLERIEDSINNRLVLYEDAENDAWIKSDHYVEVEK